MKEAGKLGGQTTVKNNPTHFKDLTKKRFAGMSKEQIQEYMRNVRAGKKTDIVCPIDNKGLL